MRLFFPSVRVSVMAVLLAACTVPAWAAGDAATDLKSQLARARMEAADLVDAPATEAAAPAADKKDEMMATDDKASRVPLAAAHAPKDALLDNAPTEKETPPVEAPPVTRTVAQTPPAPPPIVAPVEQMRVIQDGAHTAPVVAPADVPPPPRVTNLPPAAHRIGSWKMRHIGAQNASGFCLLEGTYDNSLTLMIGQRADGFATLGVNYGLEMLKTKRDYRINVATDNGFDEDFTGYAETSKTIIAQLGRKGSFFGALNDAHQLVVTMPGVVSVFDVEGINDAMTTFAQCTGVSVPQAAPATAPVAIPTPAPIVATPVVKDEPVAMPAPVAAPTPAPVAMPTPENITAPPVVTPPHIVQEAPPVAAPMPEKTVEEKASTVTALPEAKETTTAEDALADAPVASPTPIHGLLFDDKHVSAVAGSTPKASAPLAPVPMPLQEPVMPPVAAPMPTPLTAPVAPIPAPMTKASATQEVTQLLQASGVASARVTQQSDAVTWSDARSALNGTVTHASTSDILDAADQALARAQQKCAGAFDSQMGVPETIGAAQAQPMESKCTVNGKTTLSTWLLVQQDDGVHVWETQSVPARGAQMFDLREKMLNELKGK